MKKRVCRFMIELVPGVGGGWSAIVLDELAGPEPVFFTPKPKTRPQAGKEAKDWLDNNHPNWQKETVTR